MFDKFDIPNEISKRLIEEENDSDLGSIKILLHKFNLYPKFSEEEEKKIDNNMCKLNNNKKKLIEEKSYFKKEDIIEENITIVNDTYNILNKILSKYYDIFFYNYREYINNFSFEIINQSKFKKYEYYFDL